ncbi:MAG TPA: hypothetical protein VGM54_23485 [Chthoniobacter sp.]|jgi:hypothetical protein
MDWNPNIPFNYRTAIFCFLMGTLASVPISIWAGDLPKQYQIVAPSEARMRIYWFLLVGSFLLLPIWSLSAVRKYQPLPVIGLVTFVILLLLSLFPAI